MFMTDKFTDAGAKADAARENLTDMIVGYVITQLSPTPYRVATSEDLDELVRNTRDWLSVTPTPTINDISDFTCRMYYDFAGN